MNKAAFILSQSRGKTAKQIVDAAATRGISLSENYVYNVRSRAPGATSSRPVAVASAPKSRGGGRPSPHARTVGDDDVLWALATRIKAEVIPLAEGFDRFGAYQARGE